jgi:hypothetical protein
MTLPQFLSWRLILRKLLMGSSWAVASVCVLALPAMAQHGGHAGGHPAGGAHVATGGHVAAPPVVAPHGAAPANSHAPLSGPRASFQPRPIFIHRHVFIRPPFFRVRGGYPLWWRNCGGCWAWGYSCGWLPRYGPIYENYVTPIPYEVPVYVYGEPEHELVWLYSRDGTAYGVTDYWFVNNQVHFVTLEEGGAKSVEKVIGLDELDVQKTVDVNTQRGFRVVMRDEPLEQYLRDHPDANAPLLQPQQKN